MQRFTVTFTKVFTPDSTLAGLTYTETYADQTADQVARWSDFCKRHASKPVKAYCSSHYTLADFAVIPSL